MPGSSALGLLSSVLAVTAIVGVALVYLRMNWARTQIDLLEGERDAWKSRSERLAEMHEECEQRYLSLESKYQILDNKYEELRDVVQEALHRTPSTRTRRTDR